MILVKLNDLIVNLDKCQGVSLEENKIEFTLPENQCFRAEYPSDALARSAFDKLFEEIASIQGVDGAILSGPYV